MPARPALGLIGFGAFGRLIARHLHDRFPVLAHDARPMTGAFEEEAVVTPCTLARAAAAEVVVLATPVGALPQVVAAVAPHLKPGALVLDVGSVKVEPARVMAEGLPRHVDIVATHPLFGPQSARDGLEGLKIAVCPVRGDRQACVVKLLESLGLQVFVTTPEDHDREAALAQGLTHLVAKVLVQMEPLPTQLTTRSFDLVMQAVEMVRHDAPEVFAAIEHANPYARDVRRRFIALAAALDDPQKEPLNGPLDGEGGGG